MRPEERYEDTGCSIHQTCLTCPMPKCVFEEKLETQFSKARNLVISNLYNSGMEMSDIATILRVNERTIRRAIENAGEEDLTSYVVLIPAGSDGHKEVQ